MPPAPASAPAAIETPPPPKQAELPAPVAAAAPAPVAAAAPEAPPQAAATPEPAPHAAAEARPPRQLYAAAPVAVPPGAAKVAILLSGIGLTERDSRAAVDQLPAAVSFAVSAYASVPGSVLEAARQAGHELLESIPMEPQGYPQYDEGARSLRTGLSPEENRRNLEWALARTPGSVGATGASDGLRGERYADIPAALGPVVDEVTRRGMLYVDARPGRAEPPGAPVRAVDVVLDEQLGRAEIDAKLSALERVAKERGAALGLAGPLRPTTIDRIAAWAKTLPGRGLVLVPVSEIVP